MRTFSLIVVGISLIAVTIVLLQQSGLREGAGPAPGPINEIRITGAGNTLATLAARFGRPGVFEYDPKTRIARSYASLIVEGELTLGREGTPPSDGDKPDEILEFDTQTCGDRRLEVCRGGVLRLYHAHIRTVSQILSFGACSRGYALFVDGELVMKDSRISYISGSTSECLRGAAKATITDSIFSHCDGCALNCVDVDGARIHIDGCDFRGSGNWGVVVQGCGGEPLEIRNSLLDARVGALLVSGRSAHVKLVDCVFDPTKLIFNQDSGEMTVAWTRRVQVVDARTRTPMTGVRVRAEHESGVPACEPVEARTDNDGQAVLVLVERVERPGASGKTRESARYRLRLIGPAGELRAERTGLTVRGKDPGVLVVPVS